MKGNKKSIGEITLYIVGGHGYEVKYLGKM